MAITRYDIQDTGHWVRREQITSAFDTIVSDEKRNLMCFSSLDGHASMLENWGRWLVPYEPCTFYSFVLYQRLVTFLLHKAPDHAPLHEKENLSVRPFRCHSITPLHLHSASTKFASTVCSKVVGRGVHVFQ